MRFIILTSALILIPVYFISGQNTPGSFQKEELYLHTDRNFYLAGDELLFKLYLKSDNSRTSRFAYLFIRNERSDIVSHSRLEIKDGISYGSIRLADTLKTGFYQIVCFTNFMRNDPETIFRKEIIIANRFDDDAAYFDGADSYPSDKVSDVHLNNSNISEPGLRILTEKNIYGRREKISIKIDPGTLQYDDIKSLSVSVSQDPDYSRAYPGITDLFMKVTENSNSSKSYGADLTYEMENDRAVIQGIVSEMPMTLKTGNNNSPAQKYFTVFISATDTIPNLQYTKTDASGKFTVYLDPYYEGKEIWIKLRSRADAKITLDTRLEMGDAFQPVRNFDRLKVREFIKGAVKTGQIARYYGPDLKPDTILSFRSSHPAPAVYFKPYPRIYPADYIELKDLPEISREIIPALRIRKNDGSYSASFPSLQYQVLSDEEPLIFLDGVPIDNMDQIIGLGSKDIRYVETVPAVRYFNQIYFNGILNIVSSNNAIRNIGFSPPFSQLETEQSISFTKPKNFDPADLPAHYPDLRYTLFWEPDLRPKGNKLDLTVWSSDIQGDLVINVQGLTKNGQPVSGSATITVKAK